ERQRSLEPLPRLVGLVLVGGQPPVTRPCRGVVRIESERALDERGRARPIIEAVADRRACCSQSRRVVADKARRGVDRSPRAWPARRRIGRPEVDDLPGMAQSQQRVCTPISWIGGNGGFENGDGLTVVLGMLAPDFRIGLQDEIVGSEAAWRLLLGKV